MQRFHEKSVEIRQWVDQVLRVLERLAHVLKIQAKPTVSILNKLNEAVDDLWYKEPTVFPKVASLGDKDLIQRADLFRQAVNQFKENARSKKMDEANKALIKVRVHAAEIYVLLDKLENAAFTGTPSSEKEVE